MELTEEEAKVIERLADESVKYSTYQCEPTLNIYSITGE